MRYLLTTLLVLSLAAPAITATQSSQSIKVRLFLPLESDMDSTVTAALNGDLSARAFLQRFERFRVYMDGSSWPADRMYTRGWASRGWEYADAMVASYYPATTVDEYHLWSGPPGTDRQRLFVNFACDGTRCTQYAGDVGNPSFRRRYVDDARATVEAAGGLFVDDANFWMERVVSNAAGEFVRPWNPRTGAPMTQDEWADGMLALVTEAKAAFPDPLEVVVNTVPLHGPGLLNIPQAKAALAVADGWELERGFGDPDITATAFAQTFKATIDYAHSVGTFVVHDVQSAALGRVYPEAAYLCLTAGKDLYGHPDMRATTAWDPLWDRDMGAPTSDCVRGRDGIYRRSFERGSVTVDPASKIGTID